MLMPWGKQRGTHVFVNGKVNIWEPGCKTTQLRVVMGMLTMERHER